MSEDFQVEDEAEKLAESPDEVITEYLNEHGMAEKEKLIEILIERCDLSRDEAEKMVEEQVRKRKIRYGEKEGQYVASFSSGRKASFSKYTGVKPPSRRRAKARIDSILKLPSDPHTLQVKSHFLAKDNPAQPYYHPAMDQDRLAYLRAKEKMGEGADWPA